MTSSFEQNVEDEVSTDAALDKRAFHNVIVLTLSLIHI